MYKFFKDHYTVDICDPYADCPVDARKRTISHSKDYDISVVCVPTPREQDGSCDLSYVEDVISKCESSLILLKSTIEIGTTQKLVEKYNKRIVFSPEYCGESSYWSPYKFHTDVKETPFFIFGGEKTDTSKMIDYFMPVVGPTKKYIQCDAIEAEMAKYMENVFYATKITFCYEMAELCNATGIDYNTVRELWLQDPRINPMHTAVFPENDAPYSGKCLPKDTSALASLAEKYGYDAKLIKEVLSSNDRIASKRKLRRYAEDQDTTPE